MIKDKRANAKYGFKSGAISFCSRIEVKSIKKEFGKMVCNKDDKTWRP